MKRSILAVGALTIALVGVSGPVDAVTSSLTWTGAQSCAPLSSASGCRATTPAVLTAQNDRDTSAPTTDSLQTLAGTTQRAAQLHPMPGKPPNGPPGTLLPGPDSPDTVAGYVQRTAQLHPMPGKPPNGPPGTLLPGPDSLDTVAGYVQRTAPLHPMPGRPPSGPPGSLLPTTGSLETVADHARLTAQLHPMPSAPPRARPGPCCSPPSRCRRWRGTRG